jgi:MFS family permease
VAWYGINLRTVNAARSGGGEAGVSARVVALLTLAAFINYVDRGNLATAGPLIRDQFALSNAQLGLLLSAFFWSYAPGQLPAGWVAERFDARRVLAAGLIVWGVATALTGFASDFMMLLVLRVMLGLGESVMSAPVITGVVVDQTGSFGSAFLIAAAVALLGVFAFGVIVRRIEPVAWHTMDSGYPASSVTSA